MDDVIFDDEWVLVDTETTGLYPPVFAVEIAAQLFRGLVASGPSFQVIINPGVSIPAAATAVHGYTDEYVQLNGKTALEAYSQLRSYVGNRRIAAHYARFDWDTVLVPEARRLGLQPVGQLGFCTWALARRALPESSTHNLDSLREQFALSGSRSHTALGDVEATGDLLTRIIFPRLASIGLSSIYEIAHFSRQLPLQLCHLLAQGLSEFEAAKCMADLQKKQRERQAKEQEFAEYIQAIELGQVPLLEVIHQQGLIDERPIINFRGHCFLFTGKLAMGARAAAQSAVIARGGLLAKSKSVSNVVDYLVLGAENWRELEHGGKLTSAVIRRLKGLPNPILLLEEDFVAAINAQIEFTSS
jgi:DNA polymerase III epsilon subunit-like protein